jgi:2-keto-4-pentenoate hydratase/2-oxohepta-3-ene-1,7-dioic acid hydratase in catechol pathway
MNTPTWSPAKTAQIICGGMSYSAHNAELAHWFKIRDEVAGLPWFFVKSPRALIGHEDPIELPDITPLIHRSFERPFGQVTGEVELGIVMKDRVHRIRPNEVRQHVLGYTIFNDITQRDVELAGYPVSLSKGFHTFAPLGPHLVPAGDVPDPQSLRFELRVNGTVHQHGVLSEMLFSIETLVSQASRIFMLEAGDVVTTGSPPGMFDYSLQPGDVIEAEIEKIGLLRNPVTFHSSPRT